MLPVASVPTIVAPTAVKVPVDPIANPETLDVPAFSAKINFPSGVIALQQVAAPKVGTLVLIAVSVPFAATK